MHLVIKDEGKGKNRTTEETHTVQQNSMSEYE